MKLFTLSMILFSTLALSNDEGVSYHSEVALENNSVIILKKPYAFGTTSSSNERVKAHFGFLNEYQLSDTRKHNKAEQGLADRVCGFFGHQARKSIPIYVRHGLGFQEPTTIHFSSYGRDVAFIESQEFHGLYDIFKAFYRLDQVTCLKK